MMKSSMNRNFVFALVLFVVSMALGDRISDGVLTIGIGAGVLFTLIGLAQMYRKQEPTPSSAMPYGLMSVAALLIVCAVALQDRLGHLQPLALGIGMAFAVVGLFEIFGRKKPKRSA